jgi:ornithine cyclodeaminase
MKEGLFSSDSIAGELGELIMGKVEGRRSKEEITVMKTVGFATLDIVAAAEIVKKATEAGAGTVIELS